MLLVGQRTCNSQVTGSSPGSASLHSGLGQATYTCVPPTLDQAKCNQSQVSRYIFAWKKRRTDERCWKRYLLCRHGLRQVIVGSKTWTAYQYVGGCYATQLHVFHRSLLQFNVSVTLMILTTEHLITTQMQQPQTSVIFVFIYFLVLVFQLSFSFSFVLVFSIFSF